jgi:S1-C subfamily serine protease/thioredoxin-related protein
METIRFFCPSCGARLSTAGRLAPGESIDCPKCGVRFLPPQVQDDDDDLEDDPRTSPRSPGVIHKPAKPGGSLILILCLGVVGLILLSALGAGAFFVLYRLQSEPAKPAAKTPAFPQVAEPAKTEIDLKLDDWLQDLEEAKRRAAKEQKDILILLNDPNWEFQWKHLANDVLAKEEFQKKILPHFVRVYVNLPNTPAERAKLQDVQRNEQVHQQFGLTNLPAIILADAQGRPYAIRAGYEQKEADSYTATLEKLRQSRGERDKLLANFEKLQGAEKLKANQELLAYLKQKGLVKHYRSLTAEGAKLAGQLDPTNEQGILETYFEMEWVDHVKALNPEAGPERKNAVNQCLTQMNEWKKSKRFKDPNRAAELYLQTATFLETLEKRDEAFEYVDEAIGYQPTKREILQQLAMHMYRLGIGGGTGFVIAPGGYLLTNHHVVNGARQMRVRVPQLKRSVVVEVVASDADVDIALLRLKDAKGIDLKPLTLVAKRTVNRGEAVAVLGFPLGDMVGSGLKLTTGVVSATPEAGNDNKLVLDARVNFGNSGGPLLDAHGSVIGVVSAKSFGGFQIESYGLAIPAPQVEAFLQKHLKEYRPVEPPKETIGWQEVNNRVSPSVLMVIHVSKTPPKVPAGFGQGDDGP